MLNLLNKCEIHTFLTLDVIDRENQPLLGKNSEETRSGVKKTNLVCILVFLIGVAGISVAIIISYFLYYSFAVGRIYYYNYSNDFTHMCRVESDGTECVGHAG